MAFGRTNNAVSTFRSLPGSWIATGQQAAGTLTTALSGSNNDLKYTARNRGTGSNDITITYVVAGASTPLSVAVVGTAITVNVATSAGSAATSTAAQVAAAIVAAAAANYLVEVENAAGNDGTGVVTAMATTPLTGGADWNIVSSSGPMMTVRQGGTSANG